MKARVNLALLKLNHLDSGALTPLATVLHQFGTLGSYRVNIHRSGKPIAETSFSVVEDGPTQLDIDLATSNLSARASCDCDGSSGVATVSPKGYVLFYASAGAGYSVIVVDNEQRPVFDSTNLNKGDLFACTLLEPGVYEMRSANGTARTDVNVLLPTEKHSGKLRELEAQQVTWTGANFQPENFNLISSQGLVVSVLEGGLRISISKSSESANPPVDGPVHRWTKTTPSVS
jgi:hypothetical protein